MGKKAEFVFVNIFNTYQEYGGPEEGGWYYTVGHCIKSVRCIKGGPGHKATLDWAKKTYDNNKRLSRYDSSNRYMIKIQNHRGIDFPQRTPHYE